MSDPERAVRSVAIVGAGTMGRRIAYGCVSRGVQAKLHDISREVLEEAGTAVRALLEAGEPEDDDLRTDQALALLEPCDDLAQCVAGAEWVIETVPEDLDLKRVVLARIGSAAPPGAFLASSYPSPAFEREGWLTDARD